MAGEFALAGAIIATAAAQVAYKRRSLGGSLTWLFAAIALFAITPILTYLAVKMLGIATVYMSTSLTYILVSLAGWRMFGERIDRRQSGALLLILVGIAFYVIGLP